MVAAYAVGYSITKGDLEESPHLKFAAGEDDAGFIVSWNTEGPKNVEQRERWGRKPEATHSFGVS